MYEVLAETTHTTAATIPARVWARYPRSWSENLGGSMGALFPLFAHAFPQTVEQMEKLWSRPALNCEPYRTEYICKVFCLQGEKMLAMSLQAGKDEDQTDWLFDQGTEMLPPRWKELYRWFDSFYIIEGREFQRYWINTPFAFATRADANEYVKKSGADKSAAKILEKFIGSPRSQIMCWLYTDAGDALFLDEARKDHKVYHVNKGNIKDIALLSNPEDVLDDYLAHYVAGGAPKDFSFR